MLALLNVFRVVCKAPHAWQRFPATLSESAELAAQHIVFHGTSTECISGLLDDWAQRAIT